MIILYNRQLHIQTPHRVSPTATYKQDLLSSVQIVISPLEGRRKLLDCLNKPPRFSQPSFPYTQELGVQHALPLKSTEWMLRSEEMSIWRSNDEPQFLWHSGPQRSGKTRLSWYLVQEYMKQNAAFRPRLVHFFHPENQNTGDSNNYTFQPLTSNDIICSIIAQLIDGSDELVQRIPLQLQQQLLAHCQSSQPDQEATLWEAAKLILLQALVEIEKLPIIIIDGVDRLHPDQRMNFLRSIRSLWDLTKDSRSKLKVLISCRPYPDIHATIGDLPFINPEKESTGK